MKVALREIYLLAMAALLETKCPELRLLARGKVRDIYEIDSDHLLFVATDRISAFDAVMVNGIPGKGKILTQLSVFWFKLLESVMPNHLVTVDFDQMPAVVLKYRDQLEGRSLLVRRLPVLPVEAIVRGYITGSGWKEYCSKGTVCDIKLQTNLKECDRLPDPLFTPSTKAEVGGKDENIHPDKVAEIIGQSKADAMQKYAVELYQKASEFALTRGIIIADTKFEFGTDSQGNLVLIDEALTPDSSRFWPAASYETGRSQPSFDKQFVRDYLKEGGFDGLNNVTLPDHLITKTLEKYTEIFEILTGSKPKL